MTSVDQLIAEHESLCALAEALDRCVEQTAPDATTALALKTRLSVALTYHLRGEDADIYTRLAASGNPALQDMSASFRAELAVLEFDWNAYLEEWPDDAVESDWETFATDTHRMMVRLRDRIARENDHLIPVALQQSQLRLRAA